MKHGTRWKEPQIGIGHCHKRCQRGDDNSFLSNNWSCFFTNIRRTNNPLVYVLQHCSDIGLNEVTLEGDTKKIIELVNCAEKKNWAHYGQMIMDIKIFCKKKKKTRR